MLVFEHKRYVRPWWRTCLLLANVFNLFLDSFDYIFRGFNLVVFFKLSLTGNYRTHVCRNGLLGNDTPDTSLLPCLLAQRHDRHYCLTNTADGEDGIAFHHHNALQFKMPPADRICTTNPGQAPQQTAPASNRPELLTHKFVDDTTVSERVVRSSTSICHVVNSWSPNWVVTTESHEYQLQENKRWLSDHSLRTVWHLCQSHLCLLNASRLTSCWALWSIHRWSGTIILMPLRPKQQRDFGSWKHSSGQV